MKCFIGFMLPVEHREYIWRLQTRAQELVRACTGKNNISLSHGRSPLHMTFVPPFVMTGEKRLGELERAMTILMSRTQGIPIILSGIGMFAEHTVYAALDAQSVPALTKLRSELQFYASGAEREEPFVPHVTLAREFDALPFEVVHKAFLKASEEQSSFPHTLHLDSVSLFVQERAGREWAPRISFHSKPFAIA